MLSAVSRAQIRTDKIVHKLINQYNTKCDFAIFILKKSSSKQQLLMDCYEMKT